MSRKPFQLPILPTMQCDRHCGDCCGIVLCHFDEYDRVERYAKEHGIVPKPQGRICPYYQDGQCTVYEVRPMVCQLFGHSPDLVCSRGYNRNLPDDVHERVMGRYLKQGFPQRFLHEQLGSAWKAEITREEAEVT